MNTFNGGYPAQNPYFGSISPNGLNLGLLNVNPLVSFQFAKNEFGEKTFKPLVNFHVTPNENLISKVGNLFKAKKYGYGYGGQQSTSSVNQHYHTHTHFPGQSPIYHTPHHYEGPPHHYEGPPHHYEGPPHHYESGPGQFGPSEYYQSGQSGFNGGGIGNEYGFSGPGGYYRDAYSNNVDITAPASYDFDPSTNTYLSRSANGSAVEQTNYANNFPTYKQSNAQNVATANNNRNLAQNQGTQSVSFPSNRRKRSVDEFTSNSETETINETIAPKSKNIEKVINIFVLRM